MLKCRTWEELMSNYTNDVIYQWKSNCYQNGQTNTTNLMNNNKLNAYSIHDVSRTHPNTTLTTTTCTLMTTPATGAAVNMFSFYNPPISNHKPSVCFVKYNFKWIKNLPLGQMVFALSGMIKEVLAGCFEPENSFGDEDIHYNIQSFDLTNNEQPERENFMSEYLKKTFHI